MNETPVATAKANVMLYDTETSSWIPSIPPIGQTISKISLYHNPTSNSYRVVGWRLQDKAVVINCSIPRGLKYHQARTTFHQWRDSKQQVYGLNFIYPEEAEKFAAAVYAALDDLAQLHKQQMNESLTHPMNGSGILMNNISEIKVSSTPDSNGHFYDRNQLMMNDVQVTQSQIPPSQIYAGSVPPMSQQHQSPYAPAMVQVRQETVPVQNSYSMMSGNGQVATQNNTGHYQSTRPVPQQQQQPPPQLLQASHYQTSGIVNGINNDNGLSSSASVFSNYGDTRVTQSEPPEPPKAPPPPPVPQTASAPKKNIPVPPPPPPPPSSANGSNGTSAPNTRESSPPPPVVEGSFEAQLRQAKANKLRSVSTTNPPNLSQNDISAPLSPMANPVGTLNRVQGSDMMSDLQRVLAARRKARESDEADGGSADSNTGGRRASCAATTGSNAPNSYSTLRKNSTAIGLGSLANGGTPVQNSSSTTTNSTSEYITRSEFEAFKRDLVAEFRKELQQVKREILDALQQTVTRN